MGCLWVVSFGVGGCFGLGGLSSTCADWRVRLVDLTLCVPGFWYCVWGFCLIDELCLFLGVLLGYVIYCFRGFVC